MDPTMTEATTPALPFAPGTPTRISELSPELADQITRHVTGEVTITWPYNSLTSSFAFLIAEPDVRLRRVQGLVKVELVGPSARAVAATGVGAGDEITLRLDHVAWEKDGEESRPAGSRIDWKLKYNGNLEAQVKLEETGNVHDLHIDEIPAAKPGLLEATTTTLTPDDIEDSRRFDKTPSPAPKPAKRLGLDEYASPAFIKRARISYGVLWETELDEDELEPDGGRKGRGRKRPRYSVEGGMWRIRGDSPSPEPEVEVEADKGQPIQDSQPESALQAESTSQLVSNETTKRVEMPSIQLASSSLQAPRQIVMTDEGCQTDEADLSFTAPEPALAAAITAPETDSRLVDEHANGPLVSSVPQPLHNSLFTTPPVAGTSWQSTPFSSAFGIQQPVLNGFASSGFGGFGAGIGHSAFGTNAPSLSSGVGFTFSHDPIPFGQPITTSPAHEREPEQGGRITDGNQALSWPTTFVGPSEAESLQEAPLQVEPSEDATFDDPIMTNEHDDSEQEEEVVEGGGSDEEDEEAAQDEQDEVAGENEKKDEDEESEEDEQDEQDEEYDGPATQRDGYAAPQVEDGTHNVDEARHYGTQDQSIFEQGIASVALPDEAVQFELEDARHPSESEEEDYDADQKGNDYDLRNYERVSDDDDGEDVEEVEALDDGGLGEEADEDFDNNDDDEEGEYDEDEEEDEDEDEEDDGGSDGIEDNSNFHATHDAARPLISGPSRSREPVLISLLSDSEDEDEEEEEEEDKVGSDPQPQDSASYAVTTVAAPPTGQTHDRVTSSPIHHTVNDASFEGNIRGETTQQSGGTITTNINGTDRFYESFGLSQTISGSSPMDEDEPKAKPDSTDSNIETNAFLTQVEQMDQDMSQSSDDEDGVSEPREIEPDSPLWAKASQEELESVDPKSEHDEESSSLVEADVMEEEAESMQGLSTQQVENAGSIADLPRATTLESKSPKFDTMSLKGQDDLEVEHDLKSGSPVVEEPLVSQEVGHALPNPDQPGYINGLLDYIENDHSLEPSHVEETALPSSPVESSPELTLIDPAIHQLDSIETAIDQADAINTVPELPSTVSGSNSAEEEQPDILEASTQRSYEEMNCQSSERSASHASMDTTETTSKRRRRPTQKALEAQQSASNNRRLRSKSPFADLSVELARDGRPAARGRHSASNLVIDVDQSDSSRHSVDTLDSPSTQLVDNSTQYARDALESPNKQLLKTRQSSSPSRSESSHSHSLPEDDHPSAHTRSSGVHPAECHMDAHDSNHHGSNAANKTDKQPTARNEEKGRGVSSLSVPQAAESPAAHTRSTTRASRSPREARVEDASIRLARAALDSPAKQGSVTRKKPLVKTAPSTLSAQSSVPSSGESSEVEDSSTKLARAALASAVKKRPSNGKNKTKTTTAAAAHDTAQGLSKALIERLEIDMPECISLNSIKRFVNKKVDVAAVVHTHEPATISRTKTRQYMMTTRIADTSYLAKSPLKDADAVGVEVQFYRAHKESLPVLKQGDSVLLRQFVVISVAGQGGYALKTGEESSYAVIDGEVGGESEDGDVLAQVRGPPVELTDDETRYLVDLKKWYKASD